MKSSVCTPVSRGVTSQLATPSTNIGGWENKSARWCLITVGEGRVQRAVCLVQCDRDVRTSLTMATGGEEQNPNTCAVCLGNYRDPKFLPCHHTFCAPCIQDVADHHPAGCFPCPACRRETSLPPGGVASLQTNFYLQQKPGNQDMCKIHRKKELEFYCVQCQDIICINCKLTGHDSHPTEDVTAAASHKRTELQTDLQHAQCAMSDVTKRETSLQEERHYMDSRRAAVEKDIRDQHAVIVAAADRKRDEELRSLQSMHTDLVSHVVRDLQQQKDHKAELSNLIQQGNNTLTSGSPIDVITVAKEMRTGRGSQAVIAAMTSPVDRPPHSPVLLSNVSSEVVTQAIDDYLGRVCQVEMKVTERFQCAQDPDTEVFSLCHNDDDPPRVWVSYEQCGMKKDAPLKAFTETGECVDTSKRVGKVSYRRYAKGGVMTPKPQSDSFTTYCKSPTAVHFSLYNRLSGQADIDRNTLISENPLKTEIKTEFTIQVGRHRSFDVDDTEQYFVVLEEATKCTPGRRVRLFQRSAQSAVSTYSPPSADCQPSDLCFYRLRGQQVLLITDQGNSTIHVVTIDSEGFHFVRYLCGSGPSLQQPTAITVDLQNRLWVACKGGAIFTLEQLD